jgi:hypothetical protein
MTYVKALLNECLLGIGTLAMLAALLCAFATFATNDYRPVILSGIGFGLLALGCWLASVTWRREVTVDTCVIVPPSILALGELLLRLTCGAEKGT